MEVALSTAVAPDRNRKKLAIKQASLSLSRLLARSLSPTGATTQYVELVFICFFSPCFFFFYTYKTYCMFKIEQLTHIVEGGRGQGRECNEQGAKKKISSATLQGSFQGQ